MTQQLILHQPRPLVECQIAQFSWEGNVGDTEIVIYADGGGSPLEFLDSVPRTLTTTTWLVDQCAGFDCTFVLHDASTSVESSVHVSVARNPDGDTSCEKRPPFDPPGTVIGSALSNPPSSTGQPTSTPSTASAQSSVGPSSPGGLSASTGSLPTSSLTGLPSTDISPTQASSSVSADHHHHHASVVGPIVGAVCALLIIGGIGGLLYMRRRKRIRMLDSERPMSGEIHAFPVPSPAAKRSLVIMGAEPRSTQQQPLAALREENNMLGEENAVLRAVIARMQTSLPAPGDSETLPSYQSRSQ